MRHGIGRNHSFGEQRTAVWLLRDICFRYIRRGIFSGVAARQVRKEVWWFYLFWSLSFSWCGLFGENSLLSRPATKGHEFPRPLKYNEGCGNGVFKNSHLQLNEANRTFHSTDGRQSPPVSVGLFETLANRCIWGERLQGSISNSMNNFCFQWKIISINVFHLVHFINDKNICFPLPVEVHSVS